MVNFHTIEHNVLLYCLEIYWSIEMKMENFGQAHKNGIGSFNMGSNWKRNLFCIWYLKNANCKIIAKIALLIFQDCYLFKEGK